MSTTPAPEPMVSISMSAYDKLRTETRDQQAEIYRLQEALKVAQLADNSGTTKLLHDTFHTMMQIVQFAVGNLDPSTIAGWPHQALTDLSDAIDKLPGIERHITEMPQQLRDFAALAKGFEAMRKERDANKVVLMATAADFGPQTDEARRVHGAYMAARGAGQQAATEASGEIDTDGAPPPSAA